MVITLASPSCCGVKIGITSVNIRLRFVFMSHVSQVCQKYFLRENGIYDNPIIFINSFAA